MARQRRGNLSRRDALAAGVAMLGLPLVEGRAADNAPKRKLKVVVAGAHPDDPESTTGGTIARYADLGHEVVCLYLTRGQTQEKDAKPDDTAKVRTKQAEEACKILKARPVFGGQTDAATEVSPPRYDEFFKLLMAEKPDIVFTHWPIDYHRDHRATSMLVIDAWFKSGQKFELFYFEGHGGAHRLLFRPTHYVDITATEPRKRTACLLHNSGPRIYEKYHDLTNRFRGLECGRQFAEAFVCHSQGAAGVLP